MTIDKSLATDLELWFRNEVFLSAVHMLKTYLLDGDTIERWLGHESFILISGSTHICVHSYLEF